jgi:hypothetical protein
MIASFWEPPPELTEGLLFRFEVVERFGDEGRVGSIPDLRLVKRLSVVSPLLPLLSLLAREDDRLNPPSAAPPLSLLFIPCSGSEIFGISRRNRQIAYQHIATAVMCVLDHRWRKVEGEGRGGREGQMMKERQE